jgi:hypothetical protein
MTTVFSILAAAALALTLAGAPATANTQTNCDWYAKTALKQQQENEQRRCGFTGNSWSSDLKAHMTWCLTNPDRWKSEAQHRDQQLAVACRK